MKLLGIELCSYCRRDRNCSTEHAHSKLLFFLQLVRFAWKEFLLEQEIRAREDAFHAANQPRAPAWDDVDDLPTLEPMTFQCRDVEPFAERIVLHERGGWNIDHLVTEHLTAVLQSLLRGLNAVGMFTRLFRFDIGAHSRELR